MGAFLREGRGLGKRDGDAVAATWRLEAEDGANLASEALDQAGAVAPFVFRVITQRQTDAVVSNFNSEAPGVPPTAHDDLAGLPRWVGVFDSVDQRFSDDLGQRQ
jgi:hypothetical protein